MGLTSCMTQRNPRWATRSDPLIPDRADADTIFPCTPNALSGRFLPPIYLAPLSSATGQQRRENILSETAIWPHWFVCLLLPSPSSCSPIVTMTRPTIHIRYPFPQNFAVSTSLDFDFSRTIKSTVRTMKYEVVTSSTVCRKINFASIIGTFLYTLCISVCAREFCFEEQEVRIFNRSCR